MTIGVVSDTHIPGKAKVLPDVLFRYFRGVDYIIHAGDVGCAAVLEQLARLSPVTAVAGNVDPPELAEALGEKRVVESGGFRIGVTHGHGRGGTTPRRAIARFAQDDVDCIVFGHSHIPYLAEQGGVLLMNPGSPTDKRRNPCYSFGIIEASGERLCACILFFNKAGEIVGEASTQKMQ